MKTQHSKQWTNLSTTGTRIFHAGLNKSNLGKVRFFLGGGRAGAFWYFFPKKVLALPCVLIKKTPDPPPLGDRQKRHPPLTTTWHVPCCTNLRMFRLWTQSVWIWIYLDIECVRAETRKMQTISVGYLRFIAEVWIWKYLSIISVLNIKYVRENTRASFSH